MFSENINVWSLVKPFLCVEDCLAISITSKIIKDVTWQARFSSFAFYVMHHVLRGHESKVLPLLAKYPALLVEPTDGRDYSGRIFKATPFEAMLWGMDILMGVNMLSCIPADADGLSLLKILQDQFKKLEDDGLSTDLVKLQDHPSTYVMDALKSLFTNPDAVFFYEDQYFYLDKAKQEVEELSFLPDPRDFFFDRYALMALNRSMAEMDADTARHSSHAEHVLITRALGKCLVRKGLCYQYRGMRYQTSHYDFAVTEAMSLCLQYQETDPVIAKVLWEDAVARKQKEWAVVIVHEFSEPMRNFCFASPEKAKEAFKSYAKSRSVVFYDQNNLKTEAPFFPVDPKYDFSGSAIVKAARFPNPILGMPVFSKEGWKQPQELCDVDYQALKAMEAARKEGLKEIGLRLNNRIESMTETETMTPAM